MIKTKETRKILKEWRKFEFKSNVNESQAGANTQNDIRVPASRFLRCHPNQLEYANDIGEPVDEEIEEHLVRLRSVGVVSEDISIRDIAITDEDYIIDMGGKSLDQLNLKKIYHTGVRDFYIDDSHNEFIILWGRHVDWMGGPPTMYGFFHRSFFQGIPDLNKTKRQFKSSLGGAWG